MKHDDQTYADVMSELVNLALQNSGKRYHAFLFDDARYFQPAVIREHALEWVRQQRGVSYGLYDSVVGSAEDRGDGFLRVEIRQSLRYVTPIRRPISTWIALSPTHFYVWQGRIWLRPLLFCADGRYLGLRYRVGKSVKTKVFKRSGFFLRATNAQHKFPAGEWDITPPEFYRRRVDHVSP